MSKLPPELTLQGRLSTHRVHGIPYGVWLRISDAPTELFGNPQFEDSPRFAVALLVDGRLLITPRRGANNPAIVWAGTARFSLEGLSTAKFYISKRTFATIRPLRKGTHNVPVRIFKRGHFLLLEVTLP